MLKPLSLSVSLAFALVACGVSFAGGHSGCATCGIASPQGTVSPQSTVASPQSDCGGGCGLKKPCWSFKMPKFHCPKPTFTYEWVLKKKLVWGHKGGCTECGSPVYPTGQVAPSTQAPATMPAAQHTYMTIPGEMKPAVAAAADEVPPAPPIATSRSSLLPLTPSGN